MLKILQDSIIKHMNHMECCSNEEEMYSHILDDLELHGMLPPYNPPNLDHRCVDDCQWDPETEMSDDDFKAMMEKVK